MKTVINYNSSIEKWQAVNGQTFTYPAGPDGKRAALLVALKSDWPQLFTATAEVIRAHSHQVDIWQIIDRLINGAKLLVHGHVYSNGRVKSQTDPDTVYQTSWSGCPKTFHCDCPDWEHGVMKSSGLMRHGAPQTAYGHLCKHAAAQLLAWMTDWSLDDEPIPWLDGATALPASVDERTSIEDWL